MSRVLRIGTRGSQLALAQSNWVANALQEADTGLEVDVEVFTTKGDRVLDKPLSKIGGKGLFTEELEDALREGRIDLAVHSLKDLPTENPDDLTVAATPKRATPNDALVTRDAETIATLPQGIHVGTSSLRRQAQLRAARPDLVLVELRGNVDTRVGRVLEDKSLDAIILACAGLERIGMKAVIQQVIPPETMLPAPGQGALGIQARANDPEVHAALNPVHDSLTFSEVTAERALLAALGGGCQVPIGALARATDERLSLQACVAALDGKTVLRDACEGDRGDARELGERLAEQLLAQGAARIISEIDAGS